MRETNGEPEATPAESKLTEGEIAERLRAAAARALAEADARRAAAEAAPAPPVEIGGRRGPEPTRYGDWEKKGVAIDF